MKRIIIVSTGLLSLFVLAAASASAGADPKLETWIKQETTFAVEQLLKSISSPNLDSRGNRAARGSVIASPSTKDPDYFYHWVRDGALVMDIVVTLYDKEQDTQQRDALRGKLLDYITFSRTLQQLPPGTQAVFGLGEPKFLVSGALYDENWGRPQNDGAALRAFSLIRFARLRSREGDTGLVASLYSSQLPPNTLIKNDLEYVALNWPRANVDLWEETTGQHFYTRMAQHRALRRGAAFADVMNDQESACYYREHARRLQIEIQKHWNQATGLIAPILEAAVARELDIAVVLAANQTHDQDDPFFPPTHDGVLATAQRLSAEFRTIFSINTSIRTDDDDRALQPGIGRYPGDTYDGVSTRSQGNPWFLATAALAELCYRASTDFARARAIPVTKLNAPFLRSAIASEGSNLQVTEGETVKNDDPRFVGILASLVELGDGYLRRVKRHADQQTGALSEQFHRDTGFMQGARDLSWSYGAILTAIQQRELATNVLKPLQRVPVPVGK